MSVRKSERMGEWSHSLCCSLLVFAKEATSLPYFHASFRACAQ